MGTPTQFIVTARSDGRGGFKPFGTYGKHQAGAKVDIGGKSYTVTKDGRVNIPVKIMERFGLKGEDGRNRITMQFSAGKGKEGWKEIKSVIKKPVEADKDKKTGKIVTEHREGKDRDVLKPKDAGDYNWSP